MDTEYLILHEDEIDWKSLSNDKNRSFSLSEIRMFRKRIDWIDYLKTHNLSHDELEVASKHFTKSVYEFIALNNLADQDFIVKHKTDFDWRILLTSSYLTQDTLMKCESSMGYVKELILEYLSKNSLIDLYDGSYDEFLVYMDLK